MAGYTNLDQVRQEILAGSTETTDDNLLRDLIDRAEGWIDTYCKRNFGETVETRRYDWQSSTKLDLDRDLLSVTSVTDNSGQSFTENTHYYLYPLNGPPHRYLEIKSDAGQTFNWSGTPQRCVSVTGTWSYSNEVPVEVRHAAIRLTTYLYRQKDTGQFDTVSFMEGGTMVIPRGIPEDVLRWLKPYRRFLLG